MAESEIDALEEGFALDIKVAKACGIKCLCSTPVDRYYQPTGEPTSLVVDDGNGDTRRFRPSSDWNDAMMAAEKARLFYPDGFLDFDYRGEWRVQELDMCTPEARIITSHDSGPVAICRAILKAVKK